METISLTIDGKPISCPEGTSILNAAAQLGITITTLCHHPALEPHGACRLCLVEDTKSGRLFASCVTPVASDSIVVTDNDRLRTHRRTIIRLMMAEHTESCIVCSKGNQCRLRTIAGDLGVGVVDLYPMKEYKALEEANPFIIRDLNKCILCGKCIRADHDLVNVGAIDYSLRGFKARPATVGHLPLERSTCTFCGTCVSICPTGALSVKNHYFIGTPERESETVCGFCGVGCSLRLGIAYNRVIESNPADKDGTVNGSSLCVRGHFAHDFLNSAKRLTTPRIREEGALRPAEWDEALEMTAATLLTIRKKYGPHSIGFFGSTKCSNEENYLLQRMARSLLNTNNIDNNSYLSGRSALKALDNPLFEGPRPLADLEAAEAIIVIGADPCHSVPVVGYYLKRAARKGIPLIVIDPRKTELTPFAATWLQVVPETDVAIIYALTAVLADMKGYDTSFIDTSTEGFGEVRNTLPADDQGDLLRMCGIKREPLLQAGELIRKKKIAFVLGHGVMVQQQGRVVVEALSNLALMTGSVGKSAGFYLIGKENNEVGATHMGTVPHALPGCVNLNNDKGRKTWETVWQCTLSPDSGLNLVRMIEAAETGTLKALYIMGENPLRTVPQGDRVREALNKLELLVVQDILETETSELAHVVLPGAAFSEKEGSFTNMERCVQAFSPAVSPPGEGRPDWKILDALGEKLGAPQRFGSIEKIRTEIGRHLPLYRSFETMESRFWITPEHAGTTERKAQFYPVRSFTELEKDPTYDKTAIIGSHRLHLGSGTRTARSERINEFSASGCVEMCREDAAALGVDSGALVRVISPHGRIEREIRVTRIVKPGLLFVPKGFNGNDVRNLLGFASRDNDCAPAWNACPVRIEKV